MNHRDNTSPTKQKRPLLTVFCCAIIAVMAWHSLAPRFSHGASLVQARAAQIANDALDAGFNAQLTQRELLIRYRPGQSDEVGLAAFAWDQRLPFSCEPQALGYRLCRVGLPM